MVGVVGLEVGKLVGRRLNRLSLVGRRVVGLEVGLLPHKQVSMLLFSITWSDIIVRSMFIYKITIFYYIVFFYER